MPAEDDARVRVLGEVQLLRGELVRLRDREHARDLKRRMEDLQNRTIVLTGIAWSGIEADTYDIVDAFILEARASIIREFGTSAWDEPETIAKGLARMAAHPLPAAPGSAPPPPLTDEDLERIETQAKYSKTQSDLDNTVDDDEVLRLVAEVRRLRSDEWLQRAAKEILETEAARQWGATEPMLAILRKHRDAKA